MDRPEAFSEVFFGGCPHDCPDTCSMLFDVKDGQLQGVRGNPDHPMTRGGLCVKLKDYEKRHYHPDRLLYPMKRVGPKGSKQFERITWDEALDTIVTRWKAIIDQYGPHLVGGLHRHGPRPLVLRHPRRGLAGELNGWLAEIRSSSPTQRSDPRKRHIRGCGASRIASLRSQERSSHHPATVSALRGWWDRAAGRMSPPAAGRPQPFTRA
nr:molybdopterin-dependent oxidoreductase [Methylobacterium sp. P1-11]